MTTPITDYVLSPGITQMCQSFGSCWEKMSLPDRIKVAHGLCYCLYQVALVDEPPSLEGACTQGDYVFGDTQNYLGNPPEHYLITSYLQQIDTELTAQQFAQLVSVLMDSIYPELQHVSEHGPLAGAVLQQLEIHFGRDFSHSSYYNGVRHQNLIDVLQDHEADGYVIEFCRPSIHGHPYIQLRNYERKAALTNSPDRRVYIYENGWHWESLL